MSVSSPTIAVLNLFAEIDAVPLDLEIASVCVWVEQRNDGQNRWHWDVEVKRWFGDRITEVLSGQRETAKASILRCLLGGFPLEWASGSQRKLSEGARVGPDGAVLTGEEDVSSLLSCPTCGKARVARTVASSGNEDITAKLIEWGYCVGHDG